MLNKQSTITLPSFLRKSLKTYALKTLVRERGCELQRIGRSRNWQLKADFEQIQTIIHLVEASQEPSWQWLVKLLRKEYQQLSHDELVVIAGRLEDITVSALITTTDCTIGQARKVIDQLEALD